MCSEKKVYLRKKWKVINVVAFDLENLKSVNDANKNVGSCQMALSKSTWQKVHSGQFLVYII